ncbi:UDP-N-acetylmuramoyl-tripeptide--D-alanyl-D-alanine ligase [Shewanella sp. 202IG2-18]|uniref:UDP-N-acetylmuramoyl-tripeptide--D-alanyl-D- alanine ligase n=1 Tax=Parashewanella hymeniacidonis TaxID=2807618 RepID=UPI001961EF8C|nr:UDP-N-acetylmuramoyl-tripeptide--D-alanyl-D-alanine ligase [Parashewanella hymeniacidonis]MBM7070980.1 UDP-N-acetylmuramoyl-tripeptide--D-alanyl-D-alanine ligase [Parashewanella hymeniacidonis]
MILLSLSELAKALNADLVGEDCLIEAVSTDSRSIPEYGMFIALKGDRFDAHDFVNDALCQQATAILVSKRLDVSIPQLVVADTRVALGLLGAYVRQQLDIKAIAITGSNGKTSVKEMVASIFSEQYSVLYTAGNFNNDIGAPLTLLRLEPQHQIGVFELGANHKGEIDYTSNLVKPDVALVNNIGAAHLEGFGSIEAISEAKSEIYYHLKSGGTAVVNQDDKFAPYLKDVAKAHNIITFGLSDGADVTATNVQSTVDGRFGFTLKTAKGHQGIQLKLSGQHQVLNALAATAIALALNVDLETIKEGLEKLELVKGRMQPHQLGRLLLVDDSYNANPSSVKAAIDWLSERDGVKVLILGDLAEVGSEASHMLQELGQYIQKTSLTHVLTLGNEVAALSKASRSNGCDGKHFDNINKLKKYLMTNIFTQQGAINLLVKGSRSAAMERVVEAVLIAHNSGELI